MDPPIGDHVELAVRCGEQHITLRETSATDKTRPLVPLRIGTPIDRAFRLPVNLRCQSIDTLFGYDIRL